MTALTIAAGPAVAGLDFAQICRILPHGPGMILLDRVDAVEPGVAIHASKNVSPHEPCYAGLDRPNRIDDYAYPQTLVLESFGQAAGVLWALSNGTGLDGSVLMFAVARDCSFGASAYPGDVLRHVVRLTHSNSGTAIVSGHTDAGGRRIATFGSLTAVVRPRSALPGAGGDGAIDSTAKE